MKVNKPQLTLLTLTVYTFFLIQFFFLSKFTLILALLLTNVGILKIPKSIRCWQEGPVGKGGYLQA